MDRATFDQLVLQHLPAAQRFAIRLTGSSDAGEEIVQAALLRAHRNWTSFAGRSRFQTWFFQIVVNSFRDDLDRQQLRRTDALPPEMVDRIDSNPATIAESAELGRIIAAAVSELPPRQREVLVLRTYEQLPDAEIATVLNLTPQNVRTTLHLARKQLKQRLQSYLDDDHAAKPKSV